MKKRVTIFALMIFTVLLSVSAISASDVNTVDSNSTVLTAVDDSVSVDTGVQSANVELSSFNDSVSSVSNEDSLNDNSVASDDSVNYEDSISLNDNSVASDDTVIGDNQNTSNAVNLDAPSIDMYYKNGTRFIVNLTDGNGNGLANQSVIISINGMDYTRNTNDSGIASMAINLYSGIYSVNVTYKGTDVYTQTSVTSKITVLPTLHADNIVKYYMNGTQYYATFLDGNGNPLVNTTVTFNINGVFYKRDTNASGVAKLNINLRPSDYILTAYNPNDGYEAATNVTVLPTIISSDLSKLYLDKNQYYATFVDSVGNPLVNTTVTFNINGVFYKRDTNASGVAKLNINLLPNTYVLTAYHPTDGYEVANIVSVLSSVTTTIKTQDYSFVDSAGKVISATLYDQFNHAVSNQTINLNINGVSYSGTTDDNGVVNIAIDLTTSGDYTINYSFDGTSEYASSTATSTLNIYDGKGVQFVVGNTTILKGDTFWVQVIDEDGNLVVGKNVYFTINGVNYIGVTDNLGKASKTINLNPGSYTITYKFNETGYKVASGSSDVLVVDTYNTTIKGDSINVGQGAGESFYVTLTAGNVPLANRNVIISVNGVNYTRTTNGSGVASLKIGLDVGTYYIKYYFNGDDIFKASQGDAYCIVQSRTGTTIVNNGAITFNENSGSQFKVLLSDVNGNPLANKVVTFEINSAKYNRTTDENGVASLTISLSKGSYDILFSFAGDNNYLASNSGAVITVVSSITNGNGYWVFGGNMYSVDLADLASKGTGNIFLNFYAFTAHGESNVLSWIQQANAYGIKVHIWMQVFYNGGWLSPLNSDGSMNTDLFNTKIAEAKYYASLTGVAGVHLDYLRYPGTAYKHTGGTEAINEFVRLVTSAIDEVNPDCIVSAAVMPEKTDIYYYGQDIATITKYLDVIVPMVYKGNYNANTAWITSTTKWITELSSGAAVWVGLQSYASDEDVTKLSTSELTKDAQAAYDGGASGVVIFRWGVTNFINFSSLDTSSSNDTQPSAVGVVSLSAITEAATTVKKYSEANGVLPKYITLNKENYTMPQFLYLMGHATLNLANGNSSDIQSILVGDSSKCSGSAIYDELYKSEYLSLAQNLTKYIASTGNAPSNISSTLGDINYDSLMYAYARILSYYNSNSAFPAFVYVTNFLDNFSLTVTMKPSASSSYQANVYYTATWLNYCPGCKYYGTLLVNPKGVAEGELTCSYCDRDYCGVSGKEKITGSSTVLTCLSEPIPESSGKSGDSVSINSILNAAINLKTYIAANNALPDYVTLNDKKYSLSQFLYLASKAIVNINDGNFSDITVVNVSSPASASTNQLSANLNKTQYLDVANRVASYILNNGQAPNYASSDIGNIPYSELLDAFSRILAYYSQNSNVLPNSVAIKYISDATVSTSVADKAKSLVVGLNSTWDIANALFTFVRDKIQYGSYGTGAMYYNTVYGAEGTLTKGYGNCCDQSQLLVAMARSVGLTARFATGYCHFSSGLNVGHVWVQIQIDGKWVVADTTSSRNSLGVIKNWNTNSYTDRGTYDVLPY